MSTKSKHSEISRHLEMEIASGKYGDGARLPSEIQLVKQFNVSRPTVARAFRDLREMPPPQREALLNSDRTRAEFSDRERATLSGLLAAEPYVPVQTPNDTANGGK